MQKIGFLLLALMLGLSGLQAQNFVPGKLVLLSGDTLTGFVSQADKITISFKPEKNGAVKIYKLKEIEGYEKGEKLYERHTFEVLRAKFPERINDYMEVVEEGTVRLLKYEGEGLFHSMHSAYYLHELGMAIPMRINLNTKYFKRQLCSYFKDDEALVAKIKSGEYVYDQMPEIVQEYNAFLESQPKPEVQESGKKEKVIKPKKDKKAKTQDTEQPAEE